MQRTTIGITTVQPRYQIFVSSTFRDLKEERQGVLEAILELGHFPAGMEIFPAADATPWELIRTIISESDYYVLIIGGKYGSTGPDGISYTEMEHNLAVELGKPILAFLHGDPTEIPAGRTELEPEARIRLEKFRNAVSKRHCKMWLTKDELKSAVLLALVHTIRTKPATGWVRNEGLGNQELLIRLTNLQGRYDAIESELNSLRKIADQQSESDRYQDLNESFEIRFNESRSTTALSISLSWNELFFLFADDMLIPSPEYRLTVDLRLGIARLIWDTPMRQSFRPSYKKFEDLADHIEFNPSQLPTILTQLLAHGLIEPQQVQRQSGSGGDISTYIDRRWVLTSKGRNHFLQKKAFPKKLQSETR